MGDILQFPSSLLDALNSAGGEGLRGWCNDFTFTASTLCYYSNKDLIIEETEDEDFEILSWCYHEENWKSEGFFREREVILFVQEKYSGGKQ